MKKKEITQLITLILFTIMALILLMDFSNAADPQGPDGILSVNNSTKGNVSAKIFNISGGYIATFNLSATIQNPRWKAFVGNITGSFTLDDASGSTIYDWTLSSINGRVYATRNSSTVAWSNINCSNNTHLEAENTLLSHSNNDDNITKTFENRTHNSFWVGATNIGANTCPNLKTYVNDAAQITRFQEMALYDNYNIVYATILEQDQAGYDGSLFDFQMIVPENGGAGWNGATAYYLYVELS
jgi:hypothetical protein